MKRQKVLLVFSVCTLQLFLGGCSWGDNCRECTFTEIKSFAIDDEGIKYLASNDGLFSFSEEGWEKISENEMSYSLNDLSISNGENLWVATDQGAWDYFADTLLKSSIEGLISNDIHFIDIDANQNMYLATDKGVSIYFENNWFDTIGRDGLLLGYKITDIANAANSYTYITTFGGGIEQIYNDIDGISGATLFDTDWTQLKSNNVYTVFIDDTIQWFGTDKGIAIHYSEYTKWDWANLTVDDGLVSDTVFSIIKDGNENMWFGTPRGLSRYDGDNWSTFNLVSDQLLSDTIAFMDIDPAGMLWIASPKGLSQFNGQEFIHFLK